MRDSALKPLVVSGARNAPTCVGNELMRDSALKLKKRLGITYCPGSSWK